MSQIRIAVLANAGGVGKTTLVSNLAYILSQQKISVAIVDLDPQRSLDTFCGLPEVLPENSTVGLLGENFSTWNLSTPWDIDNIALWGFLHKPSKRGNKRIYSSELANSGKINEMGLG
jgi:cellulose biosynthesis protein BcsQ